MPRYSIFGAIFRAPLFSTSVYQDVARNWSGIGFWYLFLLLLITWTIVMVKVHVEVAAFAGDDFARAVQSLPPVTIRGGHVTTPVKQPYYIESIKGNKPIAVIDTTGAINTLDETDANLLLTDHKIWSRQGTNSRVYDLSKVKYFYLDKAKLTGWMTILARWFASALLPIALIGSLIWRLLQALLYGAFIRLLSNGFHADLTYAAAVRLAVVSVTPIILLDTTFWIAGLSIPMWWMIGIGISLLYMIVAVRANGNVNLSSSGGGFPVILPPLSKGAAD